MLVTEKERRFVCYLPYVRKDGEKAIVVQLFDLESFQIESFYLSQSDAEAYGFLAARFGDVFSVDISISTGKYGTKMSIERAFSVMSCLMYEQDMVEKSKKGGK